MTFFYVLGILVVLAVVLALVVMYIKLYQYLELKQTDMELLYWTRQFNEAETSYEEEQAKKKIASAERKLRRLMEDS